MKSLFQRKSHQRNEVDLSQYLVNQNDYKGKLCNQDIYVWKIHVELFDGTVIDKTGDVTLIR